MFWYWNLSINLSALQTKYRWTVFFRLLRVVQLIIWQFPEYSLCTAARLRSNKIGREALFPDFVWEHGRPVHRLPINDGRPVHRLPINDGRLYTGYLLTIAKISLQTLTILHNNDHSWAWSAWGTCGLSYILSIRRSFNNKQIKRLAFCCPLSLTASTGV